MDIFNHHLNEKLEENLSADIQPYEWNTISTADLEEQDMREYYNLGL